MSDNTPTPPKPIGEVIIFARLDMCGFSNMEFATLWRDTHGWVFVMDLSIGGREGLGFSHLLTCTTKPISQENNNINNNNSIWMAHT